MNRWLFFSNIIIQIWFNSNFNLSAQTKINFGDDLEDIWEVQKDITGEIINPKKEDVLKFSAFSAATIFTQYFIDSSLTNLVRESHTPFLDNLFKIDKYYGDMFFTSSALLVFYSAGIISGDTWTHNASLQALQAYIGSGVITFVIKHMLGRSRPLLNEGPCSYSFWPRARSRRSFPSGHSSTSFAVSTVMAAQKSNSVWKISWFSASALVGLARIYNDQHWLSDVIFGGFIGYTVGSFVVDRAKKKDNSPNANFRVYFSIPL